jgi:hypothetical protein
MQFGFDICMPYDNRNKEHDFFLVSKTFIFGTAVRLGLLRDVAILIYISIGSVNVEFGTYNGDLVIAV